VAAETLPADHSLPCEAVLLSGASYEDRLRLDADERKRLGFRAGVHPKIVQERLGHANIRITLDTYSHVLPDMQESAAELVASIVAAADAEAEGQA